MKNKVQGTWTTIHDLRKRRHGSRPMGLDQVGNSNKGKSQIQDGKFGGYQFYQVFQILYIIIG